MATFERAKTVIAHEVVNCPSNCKLLMCWLPLVPSVLERALIISTWLADKVDFIIEVFPSPSILTPTFKKDCCVSI